MRLSLALLIGLSIAPALHAQAPAASEPAYKADPKFQKAFEQAQNRRLTIEEQLENWKHAAKAAHGECIDCLHHVIALQMKLGAWKDALAGATQLEAMPIAPPEYVFAEAQRGDALMHFNYGKPKPDQLAQAETAFHNVLAKAPHTADVAFQEGRVLAMLGRDAEAKAMFQNYVDMVPASNKLRIRAERFTDDPHLATLPMPRPSAWSPAPARSCNSTT